MRKIILIGSGGSGKSTLAREMGKKLNYPVDHLDTLLWRPNWEAVSREEQRQIQHTLTRATRGSSTATTVERLIYESMPRIQSSSLIYRGHSVCTGIETDVALPQDRSTGYGGRLSGETIV